MKFTIDTAAETARNIGTALKWRFSSSFRQSDEGDRYFYHRFGLDRDILLARWAEAAHKGPRTQNRQVLFSAKGLKLMNTLDLLDLEEKRKAIARELYTQFNLVNYCRYPRELLLNQFDEKDNVSAPYGVLVEHGFDHNSAFLVPEHNQDVLWNFYKELDSDVLLRAAEIDGSFDLKKPLTAMDKRYGQHRKIEFAVLGFHEGQFTVAGSGGHLGFGSVDQARSFFVTNPTVVVNSCNAGTNGLGQRVSEVLDAEVWAPDKNSNLDSIRVCRRDGRVVPVPQYSRNAGAVLFRSGRMAGVYGNGMDYQPA